MQSRVSLKLSGKTSSLAFTNFLTHFQILFSMAPVPISPINVGHIDDVQELRKARPATIPERFVRDMTERPTLATALQPPDTVPIIDFSRLVKGNKDEYKSEMLQLTRACEEWGFFQVQVDISFSPFFLC